MNLDCTWMDPLKKAGTSYVSNIRRMSMETYMVRVYTGLLSPDVEFTSVEAEKITTADEVIKVAVRKLQLGDPDGYELAEVFSSAGQVCKERRLEGSENPVRIQLLWPKTITTTHFESGLGITSENRFYIRKKNPENAFRTSSWMEYTDPNPVDNFFMEFLKQPTSNKEYPDLCNLPDLNERTLLENIKSRYSNSNIYTYVGSILIAVNPFKFFPIYNPKYVKMYQNKRLGDLPPHIFAIADAAFHTMLRNKKNQCIVISGESGSGKTESTNLLLHHLTALSHKGLHGSGVEQTILGAGPVLEAFGNAKTVHNNNSSRFGKFIQVNYKENGMVHGAIVEKYLLEKSRIVSQAKNERNYHVFYYLLQGASDVERTKLFLGKPEDYFYLSQSDCYHLEDIDEGEEYRRLKQSMEMVGFSGVTQARIVGVLSAVLHLGNVTFKKKADQYHDESVTVLNPDTIRKISQLLKVKEKILVEALTQKKATAGGETVVMNYKMEDAVATRDAMAKCLYGALFDWIVLKVNQALLAKRHNSEHQGHSIGVLDIFGFEDFSRNSFEQFCINYANEHLQYYFNQHIFKFEQEEYKKEGIQWKNIEFIDNTGCLELFSKRGTGLFALLDEECNFPGASNDTLLSKFHHHHSKGNVYYEAPQKKELAFAVLHYAGKVKYQVKDFREKNSDQIRTDIVGNLKSSSLSFVRELMGVDPVAVLRWTIVKTLIKSMFAFIKAGNVYRKRGGPDSAVLARRKQSQQEHLSIPVVLGQGSFLNPRTPSPTSRRSLSPMHDNRYSRHLMLDLTERQAESGTGEDEEEVFLRRHSGQLKSPVDPYLSEDEMKVMRRATIVLMKNKSFKPKSRPQTMFSDIKTLKAIANRTMFGGTKIGSRMQPPSVSAQFQWSLSRLMETLNKANPFFIRCIKSNAEKAPCKFDDVLVLRQLRYTGMLATVRIRQSGYNYRLTFEEFSQLYKILLPKGLASGKEDIKSFLESTPMNQENFQIGLTKVFLRENEKLLLDDALHCAIMKRVICIQRYVKTKVERKNFIVMRENIVLLQKYIRGYLARQRLLRFMGAVRRIQRWYRCSRERKKYHLVRRSAIRIQAQVKGHLQRKRYKVLRQQYEEQRREEGEERLRQEALERTRLKSEDLQSSTSDEGVLVKDNSADELEIHNVSFERRDSEESSGILDDSGSDTLSDNKSRGESISTPPPTPTSGPEIIVHGLPGASDDELNQLRRKSRVDDIIRNFQQGNQPYSDESPTSSEKISPLSPEQLTQIEKSLRPNQGFDQQRASPIKKALKTGKNIFSTGVRKKKDSTAEESDEDGEGTTQHPLGAKRPPQLGVQVLPSQVHEPLSPKSPSPKSPELGILSGDEDDRKLKNKSKKQRQSRKHKDKELEKEKDKENRPVEPQSWTVKERTQWQYPDEWRIADVCELQLLDDFINKKINNLFRLNSEIKETQFDKVFVKCLKSFHTELKSTLSVPLQAQKDGLCNIKYRELFANFELTMVATCRDEKVDESFPVTMVINAFRSYLDEFRNIVKDKKKEKDKEKKRRKKPNKKGKRDKDTIEHLGHKFSQVQFGIPTFCELCSSIIWIMEKGHVCQICRYTCHKKCINKSSYPCRGAQQAPERIAGTKVFGVPLASLVSESDKVPIFLENLIMKIELHGLYTEGIYRKSGSANKVKKLKDLLDLGKTELNMEEYSIHVLTTSLKCFFRELPEPLLTFELYDEFLQASEIKDEKETVQALYSIIDKLPKVNHDVFQRLIFHLARVATHEASNKMSVNGLAIIFAPCLLRTSKNVQAQEMLTQVSRQTICIDKILEEQLNKIKTTLQDINTLESAVITANDRLSEVRASMRDKKGVTPKKTNVAIPLHEEEDLGEQERVLDSHIHQLRKEKDDLTSNLPVLEYRHSSDDEMLSIDDMDSTGTYETADEMEDGQEELGVNIDSSESSYCKSTL